MNAGRDVERLIADWFVEEAVLRAPDRILDGTSRVIDRTKQRRLGAAWRNPFMSAPLRVAAAAVLGVLVVGGALFMFSDQSIGPPTPSPTPTAEPTAAPTLTASPASTPTASPVRALPEGGPLTAGRYVMRMRYAPVDAEFTVSSGWSSGGWYVNTSTQSISFWTVSNIYPDACVANLADPPIGPTVDDLVTALGEQAHTEMSLPIHIVVDGHPGVRVELSPSDDVPGECNMLTLWGHSPDGESGRTIDLAGSPGERIQPIWIIDVDGERVVIVVWTSMENTVDVPENVGVMESLSLTRR